MATATERGDRLVERLWGRRLKPVAPEPQTPEPPRSVREQLRTSYKMFRKQRRIRSDTSRLY